MHELPGRFRIHQLLFDNESETIRRPPDFLNHQRISAISCVYGDLKFGELDGDPEEVGLVEV